MKQALLLSLLLLSSFSAWSAKPVSNDFSNTTDDLKSITKDDLVYRSYVKGEIFILSPDGETLINVANESREWQFGGPDAPMESNWVFNQKGLPTVAIKHKWTIEGDGKLAVEIQQYESMERTDGREVKYGKLIKEEKMKLKNFAPIDWAIKGSHHKMIVRFTPGLWPNQEPIDLGPLPVTGKNIVIYDDNGQVWADQLTLDRPAPYFGISTHRGSVYLSFVPFKGARVLGEVKGNRMRIKTGQGKLNIQSENLFIPAGFKAKVYGLMKFEEKTERLNSVRTSSSDKEEEFVKRIEKN